MAELHLDAPLVNSLLRRSFPEYALEYHGGCLLGRMKLPLGAVNVVGIPSCSSSHLILTLPFREIKGESTPGFLLSKLVSAFWGTICKQAENNLVPHLYKAGLPKTSITLQRAQTPHGDVGKMLISLTAINSWLARQHPRLRLTLLCATFTPDGIDLQGQLTPSPG